MFWMPTEQSPGLMGYQLVQELDKDYDRQIQTFSMGLLYVYTYVVFKAVYKGFAIIKEHT